MLRRPISSTRSASRRRTIPVCPEEARGRTLSGLYNVQQSVASQTNNVTMLASDAGGDYTQTHNGFLLNISARDAERPDLAGRHRHGRDGVNYCDVRAVSPEFTVLGAESDQSVVQHLHRLVDAATGLGCVHRAQGRRAGLGTFRSDKGSPLAANMIFTLGRPPLGRPFGNAPNVTVNLVEPGTSAAIA